MGGYGGNAMTDWRNDIFEGYEAATIGLENEDDGELVATLVRRTLPGGSDRCVIYVHGYSDYFFQQHLGESYLEHGYDFYAVDLRRCGRSLREGNRDGYIDNLADYSHEVAEAVRVAADEDGHSHVVLHGHSMGGLVSAQFIAQHPMGSRVDLLALNSPWLDVKLPMLQRLMWVVTTHIGQFFPHRAIPSGLSSYVDSIHSDYKGEWQFDLKWKPRDGTVVYPGWIRAVGRGHAEVKRGLDIACPVLVQHSNRSSSNDQWHDDLLVTDSVLDVDQIHRRAPRLGPMVETQAIENGMHDLVLSRQDVRGEMLDRLHDWLASHTR